MQPVKGPDAEPEAPVPLPRLVSSSGEVSSHTVSSASEAALLALPGSSAAAVASWPGKSAAPDIAKGLA